MRPLISLLLIAALAGSLCAQADTLRAVKLRHTEIHLGVGTQALAYLGVRQFIGDRFFAEAALGGKPHILFIQEGLVAHTLGIGFVPEATKYESGLCFSLLYSFVSNDFLSSEKNYRHIGTANIGYLRQHEAGVSLLARAGIGIFQSSLLLATDDYYRPYARDHDLVPWVNLEFSLGYAF